MDAIGSVGISRLARPGGSDSGGPGESRPVPSLVTGDRSLFFAPPLGFDREERGSEPIQRHKAKSRTEAVAAP